MPRPKRCRRVFFTPDFVYFKPQGIPIRNLDEITLTIDELEAIRLADLEGAYQEDAATAMEISRQTFARIVQSARQKVAQALVDGKALRLEGGKIKLADKRTFRCIACGHIWELPFGTGRPAACPECGNKNIRRDDSGHGRGRCGHGHGGRKHGRHRGSREETTKDK